jgi:hypothetical protein
VTTSRSRDRDIETSFRVLCQARVHFPRQSRHRFPASERLPPTSWSLAAVPAALSPQRDSPRLVAKS